jgi:hypothetical protein
VEENIENSNSKIVTKENPLNLNNNPLLKQRNKNLFGAMLNHLEKAKQKLDIDSTVNL